MHASVLQWASSALTAEEVAGARVLEVGSYDVNGSVRPIVEALEPESYLGIDQTAGPGVDLVMSCVDAPAALGVFDLVVCTEMLEHAPDWRACVRALAELVRPSGLLLLSTRGPGFPYHAFPVDCWRFPTASMAAIMAAVGLQVVSCVDDDRRWPGVLVKARKLVTWSAPAPGILDAIDVPAVTR